MSKSKRKTLLLKAQAANLFSAMRGRLGLDARTEAKVGEYFRANAEHLELSVETLQRLAQLRRGQG